MNAALAALAKVEDGARDKIILLGDLSPVGLPPQAPLQVSDHRLYTNQEVAEILGVGDGMVTAVKQQLGITQKKLFVSEIRDFLLKNPQWQTGDVQAGRRLKSH